LKEEKGFNFSVFDLTRPVSIHRLSARVANALLLGHQGDWEQLRHPRSNTLSGYYCQSEGMRIIPFDVSGSVNI